MKLIHSILLTLFVASSLFAQRPDREKLKALKIAHITEQLDLTQEEAQKFWPVYNANEEARNNIRTSLLESRQEISADQLTESEAKALLLEFEKAEQQKTALNSKMLKDLLEILPAKKIIKLYQAERSFKRKLIDEFKSRHAGRGRN